ncbi:hypothetical protein F5H01DRAFT_337934 [Linnemannia elongata]|nr:hypothetical protein F5H01DRAFT_337934 [Linnemannia elongata]
MQTVQVVEIMRYIGVFHPLLLLLLPLLSFSLSLTTRTMCLRFFNRTGHICSDISIQDLRLEMTSSVVWSKKEIQIKPQSRRIARPFKHKQNSHTHSLSLVFALLLALL